MQLQEAKSFVQERTSGLRSIEETMETRSIEIGWKQGIIDQKMNEILREQKVFWKEIEGQLELAQSKRANEQIVKDLVCTMLATKEAQWE